jgi:cobalt/nickel transport system permease protein
VTGRTELTAPETGVHAALGGLQRRTALLPDYEFRKEGEGGNAGVERGQSWGVDAGGAISAVVGGAATLVIAFVVGWVLRKRNGTN